MLGATNLNRKSHLELQGGTAAILIFCSFLCGAQAPILREDYTDNSNKWQIETSDPDERANIVGGRYTLHTLSQTNWHYFTIERKFDVSSGFTIESVITKLQTPQRFNINAARDVARSNKVLGTYSAKDYSKMLKGFSFIEGAQKQGIRYELRPGNSYNILNTVNPNDFNNENVALAIASINNLKEEYKYLSNEYYGIIWGCDDNSNLFSFNILPEQQAFQVISLINGEWTNLINWTSSKFILSGNSANKLAITSVNGRLNFLINDNLVGVSPYQHFFGYRVGFFVGPETKISIDNLYIHTGSSHAVLDAPSDFKASGSGFLISSKGYIVTNYHVVENAKEIFVELSENGKRKSIDGKVIVQDRNNDLAIIKISPESLPSPPFGIRTSSIDVGSSVFAMGYPFKSFLGDEVKITDGIISSKTGYMGDISTYQISVPIQPGNSGGPLFDKAGYLVGITNAGIPSADNVGYCIKASYLQNLVELLPERVDFPSVSSLQNLEFTDQIKELSKFVVAVNVK